MSLRGNKDNFRRFWIKRYLSVAPGYYVILLLTHTMNLVLKHWHLTIGFADQTNPIAVLLNVFFLHGLFPFCNNNVMAGEWLVGTLMLLYLVAPFLFQKLKQVKHKFDVLLIAFASVSHFWRQFF